MNREPLHTLEKQLLKTLQQGKQSTIEEIAESSGLKTDQVRRAAEWLKFKGFVNVEQQLRTEVSLSNEGRVTAKRGLPERRLVKILEAQGGRVRTRNVAEAFSSQEFSAALGHARRRNWVKIEHDAEGTWIRLEGSSKKTPEEDLLDRLQKGPLTVESLTDKEREVLETLEGRANLASRITIRSALVTITEEGLRRANSLKKKKELERLTPELLATGRWRHHRLRAIDVVAPTPPTYPGKKHPVQRLLDEVREIFASLGFTEIEGPIVQPCFWNFDCLFIPQDHPAREMQDTFYLADTKAGRIAHDKVIKSVRSVHQDGGTTGSRGWGYEWSLEEARRLVLRTHTTAVTVRYLEDFKPSEAKVFSVGSVFRNEKVTFKNLPEFHQIEGIAVGENVNLRDMMGLLSTFYSRLGLQKVRFWPSFFPYTEPSLQSTVYVDKFERWVELCGMGIFRPEVTLPMGVKNPVLAWGGGLERIVMLRLHLDDIRLLYENNLDLLRRAPLCR